MKRMLLLSRLPRCFLHQFPPNAQPFHLVPLRARLILVRRARPAPPRRRGAIPSRLKSGAPSQPSRIAKNAILASALLGALSKVVHVQALEALAQVQNAHARGLRLEPTARLPIRVTLAILAPPGIPALLAKLVTRAPAITRLAPAHGQERAHRRQTRVIRGTLATRARAALSRHGVVHARADLAQALSAVKVAKLATAFRRIPWPASLQR
jgi:hypothetical protein